MAIRSIARRRPRYLSSDPSRGIEYNSLKKNSNVSNKFYKFDIAFSRVYVKSFDFDTDVLRRANKANCRSVFVSQKHEKAHGRIF